MLSELVFMFVDFGKLRSPLPDSELILKMIRELRQTYDLGQQKERARARNDFGNYLKNFEQELIFIEDVAEKTKVRIVRMQEQLKSVETTLNSYRRNLEKKAKNEPAAKTTLDVVNSFLRETRGIKDKIVREATTAILEERKIRRNR